MTDKVEVIYFPKKCPYCSGILRQEPPNVVPGGRNWLACKNNDCEGFTYAVPWR